jgi:hypothetical protein
MLDRFEKSSEAEEDDATYIEVDGEACEDHPPAIINGIEHKETPNNKPPGITAGGWERKMKSSYSMGFEIARRNSGSQPARQGVSLDKKTRFSVNSSDCLRKTDLLPFQGEMERSGIE